MKLRKLLSFFWCLLFLFFCNCGSSGRKSHGREKTVTLTVEADYGKFIRSQSTEPNSRELDRAIVQAYDQFRGNDSDFFSLFLEAFQRQNPHDNVARFFVNSTGTPSGKTDSHAVIARLQQLADSAVVRAVNVLTGRVRNYGKVTYDPKHRIIAIVMYSSEYADDMYSSLLSPGDLEFTEVYSKYELMPVLQKLDAISDLTPKAIKKGTSKTSDEDTASLSLISGQEGTVSHRLFTRIYMDTGMNYPAGPIICSIQTKDTGDVQEYLRSAAVKAMLPSDIFFKYGSAEDKGKFFPLYALKRLQQQNIINGENISNAHSDFSPVSGKPDLIISLDNGGTLKMRKLTARNIGGYIAVVFNGRVLICPKVMDEISKGRIEISGDFSIGQTIEISNILMSGTISVPLKITGSQIAYSDGNSKY